MANLTDKNDALKCELQINKCTERLINERRMMTAPLTGQKIHLNKYNIF